MAYLDSIIMSIIDAARVEAGIILNMIENPSITIIGHLTRNYYKFFYPHRSVDIFPQRYWEEIATKAKTHGKILEDSPKLTFGTKLLETYLRYDVSFTIGTDAHTADAVGKIDYREINKVLSQFEVAL